MSSRKITLDTILLGETSFPLTVDELKIYMTEISNDVENLDFLLEFYELNEVLCHYETLFVDSYDDAEKGDSEKEQLLPPPHLRVIIKKVSANGSGTIADTKSLDAKIIERLLKHGLIESPQFVPMDRSAYKALVKKEGAALYMTYISPDGEKELNINSTTRKGIQAAWEKEAGIEETFGPCVKEIRTNVETNAIPRFMKYALSTNIGSAEANYRKKWSIGLWSFFITFNALMVAFGINNFFRLLSIPVCFLGFTTFWQYKSQFCLVLSGASKVKWRNQKDAKEHQVFEACVLKSHAQKRREVFIKSVVSMTVVLVILVLLPPWNFVRLRL